MNMGVGDFSEVISDGVCENVATSAGQAMALDEPFHKVVVNPVAVGLNPVERHPGVSPGIVPSM
jgi:hypothetical protein